MPEMTEIQLDERLSSADDTMQGQYLAIYLNDQQFGIAIEYVVDIIQIQPITRVPNCPNFIVGITNLRGKVIPIMDLHVRFGKPPVEITDRTCIIVLEEAGATVGLIVDSVSVVLNLADDQISPPPSFIHGVDTKFIQGVSRGEHGVTLILDCNNVLDDGALMGAGDEDDF